MESHIINVLTSRGYKCYCWYVNNLKNNATVSKISHLKIADYIDKKDFI